MSWPAKRAKSSCAAVSSRAWSRARNSAKESCMAILTAVLGGSKRSPALRLFFHGCRNSLPISGGGPHLFSERAGGAGGERAAQGFRGGVRAHQGLVVRAIVATGIYPAHS